MATRKIPLIVAAGALSFAAAAIVFGWTICGWLKSGIARAEWLLTSGRSTRGRRCDLNPQATSHANWQCLPAKCWANQGHLIAAIAQIPLPWVHLSKRLMAAEFFGVGLRAAMLYEVRQEYPQHLPA